MIAQLRATCRRLLEDGLIQAVIGYGERGPVFITRPDDAGRLLCNDRCYANLTVYLKRKELRALGKLAIMVKPCDERTLTALERESQIDRGSLYVIGMACRGIGQPKCVLCEFCFRRIGRVTEALWQVEKGDTIGFRGPYGDSYPIERWEGKNLIFIGGGIAMPPIRCAVWYAPENRAKVGNITVVYGARTVGDLVFAWELDDWSQHERVRVVRCVDPRGHVYVCKEGLVFTLQQLRKLPSDF